MFIDVPVWCRPIIFNIRAKEDYIPSLRASHGLGGRQTAHG
jgi:hypothetical protein